MSSSAGDAKLKEEDALSKHCDDSSDEEEVIDTFNKFRLDNIKLKKMAMSPNTSIQNLSLSTDSKESKAFESQIRLSESGGSDSKLNNSETKKLIIHLSEVTYLYAFAVVRIKNKIKRAIRVTRRRGPQPPRSAAKLCDAIMS